MKTNQIYLIPLILVVLSVVIICSNRFLLPPSKMSIDIISIDDDRLCLVNKIDHKVRNVLKNSDYESDYLSSFSKIFPNGIAGHDISIKNISPNNSHILVTELRALFNDFAELNSYDDSHLDLDGLNEYDPLKWLVYFKSKFTEVEVTCFMQSNDCMLISIREKTKSQVNGQ